MTLPSRTSSARSNSQATAVARQIAPTPDTPDEIYIGQSHIITGVRQMLPGNTTGLTFSTCTISRFAGASASVCGAFIGTAAYDIATPSTSVTVPSQSHALSPGLNSSGLPGLPHARRQIVGPPQQNAISIRERVAEVRRRMRNFFATSSRGGLCPPG